MNQNNQHNFSLKEKKPQKQKINGNYKPRQRFRLSRWNRFSYLTLTALMFTVVLTLVSPAWLSTEGLLAQEETQQPRQENQVIQAQAEEAAEGEEASEESAAEGEEAAPEESAEEGEEAAPEEAAAEGEEAPEEAAAEGEEAPEEAAAEGEEAPEEAAAEGEEAPEESAAEEGEEAPEESAAEEGEEAPEEAAAEEGEEAPEESAAEGEEAAPEESAAEGEEAPEESAAEGEEAPEESAAEEGEEAPEESAAEEGEEAPEEELPFAEGKKSLEEEIDERYEEWESKKASSEISHSITAISTILMTAFITLLGLEMLQLPYRRVMILIFGIIIIFTQININVFVLKESLAGYNILAEQGSILKSKLESVQTEEELKEIQEQFQELVLESLTLE